jgi:transposase
MLRLPESVQIFVAAAHSDMRKQANGLSALVAEAFGQAPASGHLFVFFNRTRDKVRILFYDRNGYCLVSKSLDRGRFRKVEIGQDATSFRISAAELGELLAGVESIPVRKRPVH